LHDIIDDEEEEQEDYPFPLTLKTKNKSPGGHSPIDGIIVQWAQLTDAEHALGSWPSEVLHAEMGYVTRHPPLPQRRALDFPPNEEEFESMRRAQKEQKRFEQEAAKAAKPASKEEKAGLLGRFIPKLPFFGKQTPRRAVLEQ